MASIKLQVKTDTKQAQKRLSAVDRQLDRIKKTGRNVGKAVGIGFQRAAVVAKRAMTSIGGSVSSLGKSITSNLSPAMLATGVAAAGAAMIVALNGVKDAVLSVGEAMLTAHKASRVWQDPKTFERVEQFARDAGIGVEKLRERAEELVPAVGAVTAEKLVKSIADAETNLGLADVGLDKLRDKYVELSALKVIGEGELESIGEIHRSLGSVEQIAAAIGKPVEDVRRQFKEGTFAASDMAQAMHNISKGGKDAAAGAAALDAATKDPARQLQRMRDEWDKFKVDFGKRIVSGIDPEKITDVVDKMIKFGDILLDAIPPDFGKTLNKALDSINSTLDYVIANWDTFGPIVKATAISLGITAAAVAALTAAFAAAVASPIALMAAMTWLGGKVSDVAGQITNFVSETISSFAKMGSDIMSGLVDGIMGGASAAISAITNVANSMIKAVKGVFGIASPSKVMRSMMEKDVAAGIQIGGHNAAMTAEQTGEEIGEAAVGGTSNAVSPINGATSIGGMSGITFGDVTITIEGNADNPQLIKDNVQIGLRQAVIEILRGGQLSAAAT